MKKKFLGIFGLLAIAFSPLALAKTDVVTFANGDRLTGEVKSLKRGKLRFKTAATDTISIEWDDVATLKSDQNIQVETANGSRYLGRLAVAPIGRHVVVETNSGKVELEAEKIVLMEPIEKKGIERFDGDITAGYNFTKAGEVQQAQFGLELQFELPDELARET